MKPNFALTLSSEGIRLLQRAPSGWLLVGDAVFDSEDLTANLTDLRSKAERLDDAPLRCKLVIPNEQIKYLTIASTAKTEEDAEDDASHALRGATPYDLHELTFDWAMDDGQLFIAAVARDTLDEAENFAVEHGFNPVSFVALPDQSDFAGEPFFGVAKWARDTLSKTDSVMRDLQPIHIIGMADLPEPEPELEQDPAPEPIPAPEPKAQPHPETAADEVPPASPLPDEAPENPSEDEDAAALAAEIDAAAMPPAQETPQPVAAPATDPAPAPAFSSVRANRTAPPAAKPAPTPQTGLDTITDPSVPVVTPDTPVATAPPIAPVPASKTTAPGALAAALKRDGKEASKPKTKTSSKQGPVQTAASPDETDKPQSETQRMTMFGMRSTDKTAAAIGGKPKHLGLVLTAILLAFLAIMAVWATFISEDGLAGLFGTDTPEVQVSALPDTPTEQPGDATPEEIAEAQDAEAAGDVTEGPNAPEPTETVALPDTPHTLTPEEAEQRYITTGIWQTAPDQPGVPDASGVADAYQASIDPTIHGTDAVALPDLSAQNDPAPGRAQNPAAAGTNFDMDQRGLVKATPEGALSPDGVLIYAGKPPLLPPTMPNRAETAQDAAEQARLSGKRPKARPENLQEKTERNQLGGRTRTELAGLRPRLRPDAINQQAVQQAVAAAVEQAQQEDTAGTDVAVLQSLKPRQRPSGFDKIVAKAEAHETDDDEGTVQTASVAPSIPSSASVARQATVKNALNLRQVNLIGVYGKPSDRRALIRLSNGRYKKVQVGDRIDGGKVAAISETELRYVKNGRAVVLKMPRG
ncbi:MAG: hypothetical protein R3D81_11510 [Thalassovita sp.]